MTGLQKTGRQGAEDLALSPVFAAIVAPQRGVDGHASSVGGRVFAADGAVAAAVRVQGLAFAGGFDQRGGQATGFNRRHVGAFAGQVGDGQQRLAEVGQGVFDVQCGEHHGPQAASCSSGSRPSAT